MSTINFQDGTILFSANLNNAFANSVNISGDTMTGNLIVPAITTSELSHMDGGIATIGTITTTYPTLNVGGMNVYSTLTAVYTEANNTQNFTQSAFNTGNSALNLAQSAFNKANNINISGSGGSTSQQTFLTSNGITANGTVNLTVVGNNTVILSANGANTTQVGVVQLNDTVTSSSLTQAATANIVQNVFITANASFVQANAVNTYAVSGYAIANSALNLSQSAYNTANAALGSGKVSKAGDTMTGNLIINASLSVSNTISVGGSLSINNVDIGSGLIQVQTNANSALNLSQSAYNRANIATSYETQNFIATNGLSVNSGSFLTTSGNNTVALAGNIGSTTQVGVVQLNDTVTSTSTTLAATANSVNTAWATAIAAFNKANTVIGGGGGSTSQLTFISSNGITVNASTSLTVVGNNTILLSANVANTTQPGIVQLNDTVISTFTTVAATANAVTTAYNTAKAAFNAANLNYSFGNTFIAANLTVTGGTSLVINSNTIMVVSANLGNTTQLGVVQLNDTVTSTSTTLAATANAVNTVWTTAAAAFVKANTGSGGSLTFLSSNGITTNSGTNLTIVGNNTVLLSVNNATTLAKGVIQLNDTIASQSVTLAATANSVNTTWTTAQAAFAKANAASGIAKTGDYMTGTLTVPSLTSNGAIYVGTISSNANVVATNLVATGVVNSAIIGVIPITSNTNYILSLRDSGEVLTFANASATLINVNSGLPVGFRTVATQIGTGSVTFRAGPGVTLNPRIGSSNTITAQYGSASLFCYATNAFILDGSIS